MAESYDVPEIYNQQDDGSYMPADEAAVSRDSFQPFRPGGNEGVMDTVDPREQEMLRAQYEYRQREQQAAADSQSPEGQMAATLAQLGAATPSQAERIRMARLQTALSNIDTAVQNGVIEAGVGQQARSAIGSQLGPLIVRRSQVPMYAARARYQATVLQNAQRAAVLQRNESYFASTAQDRLETVTLPDGRTVYGIRDGNGNIRDVPDDQAGAQESRQQQQQERQQQQQFQREQSRWDNLYREQQAIVRREVSDSMRRNTQGHRVNPDGLSWFDNGDTVSNDRVEQEIRYRTERRFGGPPPSRPGGQPGAGGQGQQGQGQQQPVDNSPSGQQAAARDAINAMRFVQPGRPQQPQRPAARPTARPQPAPQQGMPLRDDGLDAAFMH